METLNANFEDFLRLLNDKKAKYLVIGGYAVAFHGFVRATGDLDIFVELSKDNAKKLVSVFVEFGFNDPALTEAIFLEKGKIVRIGVPPLRLEILNEISGVEFSDCFRNRVEEKIGALIVPFIDVENLIKNKQASGRPRDIADVDALTKRKQT